MRLVAQLLDKIGDFEAQIIIIELLVRVASNPHLSHDFFGAGNVAVFRMFNAITKENFEAEARSFINYLNRKLGAEAKVWTIPCIAAKVIFLSLVFKGI